MPGVSTFPIKIFLITSLTATLLKAKAIEAQVPGRILTNPNIDKKDKSCIDLPGEDLFPKMDVSQTDYIACIDVLSRPQISAWPDGSSAKFDKVLVALQNCGLDKVSVITADNCGSTTSETIDEKWEEMRKPSNQCLPQIAAQNLLQALSALSVPAQHHHVRLSENGTADLRRLQEIFWTSYRDQNVRYFMWVSDRPWDIVAAAEHLFRGHSRGFGAFMPHSTRFVLVGFDRTDSSLSSTKSSTTGKPRQTHDQYDQYYRCIEDPFSFTHDMHQVVSDAELHLAGSKFDNILIIVYKQNTSCDSCYLLQKPFTLMWKENRERKFQRVTGAWDQAENINRVQLGSIGESRSKREAKKNCDLFPNSRCGLNGRHLVVLAKEWSPYLTAVGDGSRYEGFLADVIHGLSTAMNFTYIMTPDPATSRNITLRELERKLGNDLEADLMARLYYVTSTMVYNQSVTHPVVMANMSGAYFLKTPWKLHSTLLIIVSQPFEVLVLQFWIFILFYGMMCHLQNRWLIISDIPSAQLEDTYSRSSVSIFQRKVDEPYKCSCTGKTVGSTVKSFRAGRKLLRRHGAAQNHSFNKHEENKPPNCVRSKSQSLRNLFDAFSSQVTSETNRPAPRSSGLRGKSGNGSGSPMPRYRISFRRRVLSKIGRLSFRLPGMFNPSNPSIPPRKNVGSMKTLKDIEKNVPEDLTARGCASTDITRISAPQGYRQRLPHGHAVDRRLQFCRSLSYANTMIFDFIGTVFGQNNVPTPRFFTGRLLLFSWCLCIVIVVNTLKGDLASMLVASPTTPPFQRFSDVQAREDYRWGTFNSSFLPIMERANLPPLKELYHGIKRFLKTDPDILSQTEDELVAKAAGDDKFVAIIDSFFLDMIIREKGYSNVHVIPEILGTTGLGLSLPPHSELRNIMSEYIIAMVDAGLIEHYLKQTYQQLTNKAGPSTQAGEPQRVGMALHETLDLFHMCWPFVVAAAGALIAEIVIAWYCRKNPDSGTSREARQAQTHVFKTCRKCTSLF